MFAKSVFGDIFVGVQWIGEFIIRMRAMGFLLIACMVLVNLKQFTNGRTTLKVITTTYVSTTTKYVCKSI